MSKVLIPRPASGDYSPYHDAYVQLVPEGDVIAQLKRQGRQAEKVYRGLTKKQAGHRYAPDKWSIREVVGHVNDAERVFAYRALSFARGDNTPLPSFDENAWGATSNADQRSMTDLIDEMVAVRGATLTLFRGFSPEEIAREGIASGKRVTVAAIAYVIAGHELHHLKILNERYLTF